MNAKVEGRRITITLSRRNLRTLLLKLERPDSARTLVRTTDEGYILVIHAEDDDEHYQDRKPGPVHPAEENRL